MSNYAEYNEKYNQHGDKYAMYFETLDALKNLVESKKTEIHAELKKEVYKIAGATYNEPFRDNVRIFLEQPVCASIQLTTERAIRSLLNDISELPEDDENEIFDSLFNPDAKQSLRQILTGLRVDLEDYNEISRSKYRFEKRILGMHKSEDGTSEEQEWQDDQNFAFDKSQMPDDSRADDIEETDRIGAN